MGLFDTPDFRKNFVEKHKNHKVIDLGCGPSKFPGSIGVDFIKSPCVDIVHNLNQYPYPIETGIDAVFMNHVIEHVEDIPRTIEEVHRLLVPGGELWIATPHFTDSSSYIDPTHKYHLGLRSFTQFCAPRSDMFVMELAYVVLKGRWKNLGYEKYINTRPSKNEISRRARIWEDRYSFTRRGAEMFFILKKTG